MLSIVLQKYANNEIRLGCQSIRRSGRIAADGAISRSNESYAKAAQAVETVQALYNSGLLIGWDRRGRYNVSEYGLVEAERDLRSPLDIINEFQRRSLSKREKGGWGFSPKPTTFSKYARHTLLEAGAICDRELGKNLVEVTCTIPGNTREAFEAVANWSGWIMNRLCQLVRRNLPDAMWFYCWELQKRGALHLHFAIGHQSLAAAKSLAHQLEFQWWELLLELRDRAKVDVFDRGNGKSWRSQPQVWQSHVLPVYKSVAAYFSKYLGKGVGNRQRHTSRADFFCPARWWGCSSNLKQLISKSRAKWEIQVTSLQSEQIVYKLREFLSQGGVVSQYNYEFDLGVSKKGYPIGGGWREIRYYAPDVFQRVQTWLPSVIDDVCIDVCVPESCIHRQPTVVCSEYDLVQQFKHSRDQAPPSPLSQPIRCQSDSLLSTGISRKRTVDRKVIDIQSLREGRGGAVPTSAMSALSVVISAQESMQTSPCLQLSIPGLVVSSNNISNKRIDKRMRCT